MNIKNYDTEKLKLFGYFVMMIVLAVPLSEMLGTAWERANIARELVRTPVILGIDLEATTVLLFGVYLTLLSLMTLDPKKRWQGVLLWCGTALGLLGLRSMGLFLPNIDLLAEVKWLGAGAAIGFFAGGGQKLVTRNDTEILEFRRATLAIYYMLVSIAIVALFEHHLSYPDMFDVSRSGVQIWTDPQATVSLSRQSLLTNVGVSALFLVAVQRFVQYDAEQDFFVLGPPGSGKSLFMIGAYLEALERSREEDGGVPMQPSPDLMEIVDKLDQRKNDWIVEATGQGEVKNLEFRFVQGRVFPKNVRISGADYAGEYLRRLPDALTHAIPEEEMSDTLRELAGYVREADTLILIVDIERYLDDEPLEISDYFSILQSSDIDNVVIAATKADYLADQFRDERGLEAHRYYDDFKEYVESELRQSSQIETLLQDTTRSEIHPLYFQTRTNEDGERVPMRDEGGSVMPVGFDELLDELGS